MEEHSWWLDICPATVGPVPYYGVAQCCTVNSQLKNTRLLSESLTRTLGNVCYGNLATTRNVILKQSNWFLIFSNSSLYTLFMRQCRNNCHLWRHQQSHSQEKIYLDMRKILKTCPMMELIMCLLIFSIS